MLACAAAVVAQQLLPDAAGSATLLLEFALGLVGGSLIAAWCLVRPALRRIERLVAALAAFERRGYAPPLQLPHAAAAADANGDSIAQLTAQLERVGLHVQAQGAGLAQGLRQRRELLANVSHDLRTPLASMQGYLELLLLRHGHLDSAEAHNHLQTAARQSERLARLVGDLFELTRLEADDMRAEQEPFVAAELAQDVAQKFAGDAQRRAVALTTRCADATGANGATLVRADIALIERVLDNLVDNALRHTPAGGRVTIEIERNERCAHLAVQDTGVGIAAEDLPGLFERYDRASRVGTAAASSGAGLGLAIARRIVGLHGSQLQVHSAPGQGTRVSFDLALAQRPTAET